MKVKVNNQTNVIIYCRVSTDEQRKGTSVEVQEERLREYCKRMGYNIIELPNFKEDESAKTFKKRPVMQSILKYIKSHKKEVDKLLFLRWNRFSRDLPQAANVVQDLRFMGVEPNAIEEEIDFNNSNWPTLLGIYIGQAQGDNLSRSKATKDGIYGTASQGKCYNKAPRGYKNKHRVDANGMVIEKYVEFSEEARSIRKAFEEFAKSTISADYARRRYCPQIAESTFMGMLRNPFYMGKIKVPEYNGKPSYLVDGQHEPLISEETFQKMQELLDGKKKGKPKLCKPTNPDLFLRKFLVCPICGHALTGATSRGNGGKYTYYNCCHDAKHIRKRAEDVNEGFAKYVGALKPKEEVLNLYEEVLKDLHGDSKREIQAEIDKLKKEVAAKQSQIEEVEDLLIMDKNHSDRYNRILERYEKEVSELQTRISALELTKRENIEPKLDYAILLINNIDKYIRDAPLETKIKLIGSIFEDKIEFDGEKYRTNSYNKVLDLIFQQTNELRGDKKEKGERNSSFSNSVPRPGVEPGWILLHWCLRPARLPIPPSGHLFFQMCCKGSAYF